jgi:hypothetical protein
MAESWRVFRVERRESKEINTTVLGWLKNMSVYNYALS